MSVFNYLLLSRQVYYNLGESIAHGNVQGRLINLVLQNASTLITQLAFSCSRVWLTKVKKYMYIPVCFSMVLS